MNNHRRRRPQRPTWIPYVLLPFKGRRDARRSEQGTASYCDKLFLREMAIEAREVAAAEQETHPIREAASRQLMTRWQLRGRLTLPPVPSGQSDPASIRLQRRDAQEREAAQEGLVACERELTSLQESLTHVHILLRERLNECQAQAREAVSLYLKDVAPAERVSQYQEAIGTGCMEAYLSRHESLDNELRRTVELLRKEEETVCQ